MKKALLNLAAMAAIMAGTSIPAVSAHAQDMNAPANTNAPAADMNAPAMAQAITADPVKVDAMKMAQRDLWVNHIFWVRNVVVDRLDHNKAAEAESEKQVVANAKAIAAWMEPFYGSDAKDKFFDLLAGHYGAVKAYLDASVEKDRKKQDAAKDQMLANADQIAVFLSAANPNLTKDAVNSLLQEHGGQHMAQIEELRDKKYTAEAKTWMDMEQHVYVISDTVADALAKQFPEKMAQR